MKGCTCKEGGRRKIESGTREQEEVGVREQEGGWGE